MEKQLTARRYEGNADWSNSRSLKHSNRTKSTRSLRVPHRSDRSSQISTTLQSLTEGKEQTPHELQLPDPEEETLEPLSTKDRLEHLLQRGKETLADQWRRATQSGNDPYVTVSLKPVPDDAEPMCFSTLPILGGGSNVEFHAELDNGEHTFLCGDDLNALKHKYLKIEVFDKETGTSDRLIGTAHVILKQLKDTLGITSYQNEMALYGGVENNYQWSGTIDIEATFKQISNKEAERIKGENSPTATLRQGKSSNKKGKRGRAGTDVGAIILKKMKTSCDVRELEAEMEKQLAEEEAKKRETNVSKARIIQGFVIDFVLFISLILSGTLFFASLNVYEVDAQTQYMQQQFGVQLSIIDSFRFSIVTVTTIGYGEFYPLTVGGKVFGSFLIIFGVSLLARLLSTILDRAAAKYKMDRLRRITNRRAVTHDSMNEFDEDDDGIITKYEFLKTMLLRRGDTDVTVIEEIMQKFDEYDEDHSGEIEVAEIKELIRRKKEREEEEEEEEEEEKRKCCKWCNGNGNTTKERATTNESDAQAQMDADQYDFEFDDEDDYGTELGLLDNIRKSQYALTIRVAGCDDLREADELVAVEDSFWSFMKGWLGFMLYLMFGAGIFALVEDAKYADMLWFFVVTTCTVGYGDVNPKSQTGRILNAFFISISVVLFVSTFSSTFDYLYARQEAMMSKKAMKKRSMDDMIRHFPVLDKALKKRDRQKKKDKKKELEKTERNNENETVTKSSKEEP